MTSTLQKLGLHPQEKEAKRDTLGVGVDAILDLTVGLNRYTRDDSLRENILEHYRISLERMTALARSVGAEVIFVTPASSLNDCTPFKSQHNPGLDPAAIQRLEEILTKGKEAMRAENWQEALTLLQTAAAEDNRHAELQYRRAQTLLELGRFEEAEIAFQIARDEDVCPLRALTPMRQIVAEVAKQQDAGLVDYVEILNRYMQSTKGYPIPGEELFLDHVHPTIEGHKILALALVDKMIEQGLAQPGADWGPQAIERITSQIEGGINREVHGQALANLARVLLWAGKLEDAARSARLAQEKAGDIRQVAVDSASILASVYYRQGQLKRATQMLYTSLETAPGAIELRLKLGENLLEPQQQQLEEAAANLLLVSQQMPDYDRGHELFGLAMSKRGALDNAYDSLTTALRLNPKNATARKTLARVQKLMGDYTPSLPPPRPVLSVYPSNAPHILRQVRIDQSGNLVTDGIEVEFYENGRLKYFADKFAGKLNGLEVTWDSDGRLLSRKAYRDNVLIDEESGS